MELGLFLTVVVLPLTPLHSIFEFSNVVRGILFCDLTVSIGLIILPFSLILDIELLIYLKPSSLFLAVDPLPSVKVSVRIKHRSVAMRSTIEFFSLVSIFFDDPTQFAETRGFSFAEYRRKGRMDVKGFIWRRSDCYFYLSFYGLWRCFLVAAVSEEPVHSINNLTEKVGLVNIIKVDIP